MIDDMQLRNLAASTQRQYIAYVAGFAKYFGKSPAELDIEAVRQYQLYLLNERKLSPESVNQYISAVQFLYCSTLEMPWTSEYFPRAHRHHKLPIVLSQEEVLAYGPKTQLLLFLRLLPAGAESACGYAPVLEGLRVCTGVVRAEWCPVELRAPSF
jgi:site-specific recombinase XerD